MGTSSCACAATPHVRLARQAELVGPDGAGEECSGAPRGLRSRLHALQADHGPAPHRATHRPAQGRAPWALPRAPSRDAHELRSLYSDLLIGVTDFFRDREPFELSRRPLPPLFDKRPIDSPIRIWVAGCSSGEEAYSIAIASSSISMSAPAGSRSRSSRPTSTRTGARLARQALYPPNIEIDVSPGRLQPLLHRHDKGYQVSRQVRDIVVFARHDLGKDPPFSHLDSSAVETCSSTCRALAEEGDADLPLRAQPRRLPASRDVRIRRRVVGPLLAGRSEAQGLRQEERCLGGGVRLPADGPASRDSPSFGEPFGHRASHGR